MSHQTPRTPEENGFFRTLKDAINGDGEALQQVVSPTASAAVFGHNYFLSRDESPTNFTAENTWTQISDFGGAQGNFPRGKYTIEVNVEWTIDTGNERDSAVRLLVNGVEGRPFFATSASATEFNQISFFSDFSLESAADVTFTVEGIVSTGGGAIQFVPGLCQIRGWEVSSEPDPPAAQIVVTP